MNGLPDFIRLLDGDELATATEIYDSLVPALEREDGHRGARLAERTRVVYESGGLSERSIEHLDALASAASVLGETDVYVCDHVSDPKPISRFSSRLGVLRADFSELVQFVRNADWSAVRDSDGEWRSPALAGWPSEAIEIAEPVFVDDWALISTSGRWGWVDTIVMEDCKLTGPAEFMHAYRLARPDAIIDPISFLHSDGGVLIGDWVERPRTGWMRHIWPTESVIEESFGQSAIEYFEPMYGLQGAQRIGEIYFFSAEGMDELGSFPTWEAKERHFTERLRSNPEMIDDLIALWDGSYGAKT